MNTFTQRLKHHSTQKGHDGITQGFDIANS